MLAHGALLALAGSRAAPAAPPAAAAAPALVVMLLPAPAASVRPLAPPSPSAIVHRSSAGAAAAPAARPPAVADDSAARDAVPQVAAGLVGGELLVLPGVPGRYIKVRFEVDAEGAVTALDMQGKYTEEEERARVLAALQAVRFHPAHAGGMPVAASVTLELQVVPGLGL